MKGRRSTVLLAGGVFLVAINLRPAAASIGPVLNRIESGSGLSPSAAGALTTLPVLCFGLLAPLAPLLARRLGLRRALAAALVLLLAGMLVRLVPGVALLYAGTALAGTGIAVGNVLLPVLIRRDFPDRTGTAMALYTTSLIGFAALSAGLTVPLADALGGGWRPGLAVWAIPAALGVLAWLPAAARRADEAVGPARSAAGRATAEAAPVASGSTAEAARARAADAESGVDGLRALLRHPLAWQVTLFFALQSGVFYATLAWLPSIFRSHGASDTTAGLLLSLTMAIGMGAAIGTPGLASRFRDQRALVVGSCALTAAGLLGILLAPMAAPYLWVVLLGIGQNAAFPLALMLIVLRGGTVAQTQRLSTLAQSVGYVLAALAPIAVGALHGQSGSWTPALILLIALVVPELLLGLPAGRDRRLADAVVRGPEPQASVAVTGD